MPRSTAVRLIIDLTAVAAAVVHPSTGAVEQAVERLRLGDLTMLVLLHLPILILMGSAYS